MTTATEEPDTKLARRPASEIAFGIPVTNWDDAFRLANAFSKSGIVPKHFQGKPEDIVVAMQLGAEVGLSPMAALQSIAVINGRPGLWGDGQMAVVMASPPYVAHSEYFELETGERVHALTASDLQNDFTRAVCQIWRRGISLPFTASFSISEAKRARLWTKPGPWTEYPARMLKWRARGFAIRDGFSPELRGLSVSAEELQDLEAPVIEAPIVAPIRRSEKAAKAAEAPPINEPVAVRNVADPEAPEPVDLPPAPPESAPARAPIPDDVPEKEPWDPRKPGPDTKVVDIPRRGPGRPPKHPAPPPVAAEATSADSVVITDTAYINPRDSDPYYEIRARVQKEGKAPIAYVFLTRDRNMYDLAASAEGTPHTFTVTWTIGKRADGSACKVLDSISAF